VTQRLRGLQSACRECVNTQPPNSVYGKRRDADIGARDDGEVGTAASLSLGLRLRQAARRRANRFGGRCSGSSTFTSMGDRAIVSVPIVTLTAASSSRMSLSEAFFCRSSMMFSLRACALRNGSVTAA